MAKSRNYKWGIAPRVNVTGDREIREAFRRVEKAAKRTILVNAMKEAMEPVLSHARAEVDVDTGHLRSSLALTTKGEEKGRVRVDVGVKGVKYAGFEEYGVKSRTRAPENALLDTYHAEKDRAAMRAMAAIVAGIEKEVSRG